MYHPDLIAEDEALVADRVRHLYPDGLPWYTVEEAADLTASAMAARAEDGSFRRPLTADEQDFIGSSRLRVTYDFPYFAERFCNTEEAPIWMADMTMRPIGDVQVGDMVVGWEPLGGAALRRNEKRRTGAQPLRDTLTPSRVLAKAERRAPIVRVVLQSGRELRCTPDHLWRRGCGSRGGSWTKKATGERTQYRYPWTEAKVGRDLCHVINPALFIPPATDADRRLAGWLGGIFDGEGSWHRIAQSCTANPAICDRIAEALRHFNIPFTQDDDGFYLVGGRAGYARFQAIAQPTKTSLLPHIFSAAFGTPDRIISVLPAGEATVVSMQTTTGNYIAWGYASKNCWIDEEGHGLRRLSPMWESQKMVLDQLGRIELQHVETGSPDGLLLNILKARQLGVSTLSESLVAHRICTRAHIRALSGADVEDQAGYLFRMVVRIYDQLPWFLKPERVYFNKNRELSLANQSFLKTAWGKSTRGALQSVSGTEGTKGSIGRGQTFSVVHISELPTWENPEQLDTGLLPAIPVAPDTLVLFEATAEYAGDWWHKHWLATGEGVGRFRNIFIPWSAEPKKYSLPAPLDWTPLASTLAHAEKAERDSPKWYAGKTVRLSRDQLYWYETTRRFYDAKGMLYKFLKEYPADDHECFQYAGRSVFTLEQLEAIDRAGSLRPLLDVWAVEPALEIATLRKDPDKPSADLQKARVVPPLAPHVARYGSTLQHETMPVPPGYGFRRLDREQLAQLPNLRQSVMAIWEYPRLRGARRYVMSVDVSDGLGLDYSVIDVIRQPTIEEPAEQVAQYCTNRLDPKALAFVCDAIGRYYADSDGIEALAAIETNNHGLATQDTLQLHLGYCHFYVWEYADAASQERRYSTRIGWQTSPRTRPLLLASFYGAITTMDPISSLPDYVLNSPITRGELRHFITETTIGEAEAARGQHDDAVMSAAIGYYVAWRMSGGEVEPVAERRRRRTAADALAVHNATPRPDYRNSPATLEEADDLEQDHESERTLDDLYRIDGEADSDLYFSDRDRA